MGEDILPPSFIDWSIVNPKDYREELKIFIESGSNDRHRHLSHATYVVKTEDSFGQEVYGIQYHKTVIFAIREDGTYWFNNGGYFTATTKKRINDCLIKSGNYDQIIQRSFKWHIGSAHIDFGYMLFDVNHEHQECITINCWAMPLNEVDSKNKKITNYYLSRS
jgi:hypothetical protein